MRPSQAGPPTPAAFRGRRYIGRGVRGGGDAHAAAQPRLRRNPGAAASVISFPSRTTRQVGPFSAAASVGNEKKHGVLECIVRDMGSERNEEGGGEG